MESNYINSIKNILSKRTLPDSPASFLQSSSQVMIYGAGNCGKDVLSVLTQQGIPVTGFLDSKMPAGTYVNGVPVLRPDDKAIERDRRSDVCLIIAIFNAFTDIVPIIRELKSYGYTNIITFLDFYRHYPDALGDRFWLTSTKLYDSLEALLAEGLSVWHDEQSRALYKAILEFRCTGNYEILPRPETEKQYFDKNLPRWRTPLELIDCGSYEGDTLVDLKNMYGTVSTIVAFEPDPLNFIQLGRMVESSDTPFADKIILYPCGVWSSTTQLQFDSSAASSHVSATGALQVQCVSLDEALHNIAPTLIKMDIEGAEYEALLGARRMITKHKPGLAICVYHRPEHLWQIPLMLRQWSLGYKFYLRAYCYAGFDVVLYAVNE